MKAFIRLITVAALAICAATPQNVAALKEEQSQVDSDILGAFFNNVRHLLNQEDFNQLEQIAGSARIKKERFAGGDWKLSEFYRVVQGPGYLTAPDASWINHIERLQRWAAAKPESITPRVALGSAYLRYAWKARGNGYANTVTEDSWKLFYARVQQAREVLEQAENLPTKDPQLYCNLQTVALAQGWARPQTDQLVEQVMLAEPSYFYAYNRQTNFLMTKWHGKPGEAEAFAQSIADKIGGDEGNFVYFRIASSQNCCRSTQLPALSWDRVKRGFAALESMYGSNNFQRNAIAYMAVMQNDQEFARQMFTRIGPDWGSAVWRSKENFEQSKATLAPPSKHTQEASN